MPKTTVADSVRAGPLQATALWPNRSTASDGTIGDARHAAEESDHNPDARGIVHAFDLTHDPVHGVDCNILVARIVLRRDPRVKYLIWAGRIWRSYDRPKTATRLFLEAWKSEEYTGSDPHTNHLHDSILSTIVAENDTRPWWQDESQPTAPPEEDDMPAYWVLLVPDTNPAPGNTDGLGRRAVLVVDRTGATFALNDAAEFKALSEFGENRTDVRSAEYDPATDQVVLTAGDWRMEAGRAVVDTYALPRR
jgi:hypothetical protein